ncbi:MAG: hypothetical protein Q9207_002288 [Kuettlingeria erythrocarpa]
MPPHPGAFGHGDPRGPPAGSPGGSDISDDGTFYTAEDSGGYSTDPFGDDLDFLDGSLGGPPRRGGREEGGFVPGGQGGRHPGHPPMRGGMHGPGGGRGGGGMMYPGAAGGRHGGHHGGGHHHGAAPHHGAGPRQGRDPRAGVAGLGPWHRLFHRVVEGRYTCSRTDHRYGSDCDDALATALLSCARDVGYRGPPEFNALARYLHPEIAVHVAAQIDDDVARMARGGREPRGDRPGGHRGRRGPPEMGRRVDMGWEMLSDSTY